MSITLRTLQQRRTKAVADARALLDAVAATQRDDLNDAETLQYAALKADLARIDAAIARENEQLAAEASVVAAPGNPAMIQVVENALADPKRGFKTFGEYAQCVRLAGIKGGRTDDRLLSIEAAAPTTFANEASGQDGGFLVPPEYATSIWSYSLEGTNLLPMCDGYSVTGNSMVFPKDETTPWGTDGVRAYWQNEATAATATKPKFGITTLRLHKLMALVPLTDELMADGPTLGAYLTKKIGDSIRWKTNEAILYGIGNGQPQGALQGNAAIVFTKESGQANGTLVVLNLAKMIARLPEGSYGRAVWLINNDVLPALFTMTLGNYPIYVPIGGFKDNPFGMILGRPAMVTQHAKSFGSQGDVQLHDLQYYRTITKAAGVETATSMHLYFDADATAFRTTFRMDGEPTIVAPIKPANGSNNLSPFIQLGGRP